MMLRRINKAQPSVWTNPKTLQFGLGPEATKLIDLTVDQQRIINALLTGVPEGHEANLDRSLGIEKGETKALLERLGPVIETYSKENTGAWNQMAFTEIARASLDYQVNGEMVLAERWQRKVHIDQLDRTGLLLAKALLGAGVGQIVSHDTGLVLATDLGELGYPIEHKDQKRFSALGKLLAEVSRSPEPRLVDLNQPENQKLTISFAVTVGHLALEPRKYSRWLSRDVPHLGIIFELDKANVSPVVMPGETGCLNCMQEELVDQNDNWPVIASQLIGLPRVRDDAAALLTAVGLATRSILRALDSLAGFQISAQAQAESLLGYKINFRTGSIERYKINVHELCTCTNFSQRNSDSEI